MTTRSNSNQLCLFCGVKANYYNSILKRYVCSDPYQDCPAFDPIIQHQMNCDICKQDNYTYYLYKINCYELHYIMDMVKPPHQRKHNPIILRKKIDIQKGIAVCYICGKVGSKYLRQQNVCCSLKSTGCPGYKKHMSKLFKKKYEDNPELRVKMSEVMKDVQNREEVKNAKSLKMLHLHNDPCNKCQTFRVKYNKAQKARRDPNYWKFRYYRKEKD